MKVVFPNSYGHKLPQKSRVDALQKEFRFSDEYASFLMTQNGFSFDKLESDENKGACLEKSENTSENHADLRVIYGLDSGDEHYELQDNLKFFIFKEVFFSIGIDYGGNELIEILAGKFKGYIASLDHEMYASSSSIEEFIEEFELDGFDDMTIDEKADALADEDMGLAWLFSPSIDDFMKSCVHCNNDFSGFLVESIASDNNA
jgi:hypothetical protein